MGTCQPRSRRSTATGATVAITEFADKVVVGGNAYVAVYSRVGVDNQTEPHGDSKSRSLARPRPPQPGA